MRRTPRCLVDPSGTPVKTVAARRDVPIIFLPPSYLILSASDELQSDTLAMQ